MKMKALLILYFFYFIPEITSKCERTFDHNNVKCIIDSGKTRILTFNYCVDLLDDPQREPKILAMKGTGQTIKTWYRGAIANQPQLSAIIFNNNDIIKIKTKAFYNLSRLEEINFAHNNIEIIEEEAFSDLPIKVIRLHDNKIFLMEPSTFKNLPNLRTLYLWKNKLNVWDKDWFDNATALKSIILGKNHITTLPKYAFKKEYFPNLMQIDLSENQLQHIYRDAFFGTDRLTVLSLSQNRLKELPDELFQDCASLKTLFLHGNNFTFFDNNFFNFTRNLRYLTILGNPWQCPCYKAIEEWCTTNEIQLNVINYGCMNINNPVCIYNNYQYRDICERESYSDVYNAYYKNFDYFYNDSICTRLSVNVPRIISASDNNDWFQ